MPTNYCSLPRLKVSERIVLCAVCQGVREENIHHNCISEIMKKLNEVDEIRKEIQKLSGKMDYLLSIIVKARKGK